MAARARDARDAGRASASGLGGGRLRCTRLHAACPRPPPLAARAARSLLRVRALVQRPGYARHARYARAFERGGVVRDLGWRFGAWRAGMWPRDARAEGSRQGGCSVAVASEVKRNVISVFLDELPATQFVQNATPHSSTQVPTRARSTTTSHASTHITRSSQGLHTEGLLTTSTTVV